MRERLAVHDKLHVILGAAGMQHAVTFVEPAGRLVDEIEKVAAGLHAELVADGLLADGKHRGGARGVNERDFVGDLDLCCDRCDSKGDAEFHWDFGVEFDQLAPIGETLSFHVEAIDTEGQILQDVMPVIGNLECALEAVSFAEKFAASGERGALGIADVEMKLAAQTLGTDHGRSGTKERGCEQRKEMAKAIKRMRHHLRNRFDLGRRKNA